MKPILLSFLSCLFVLACVAQDAKTRAQAEAKKTEAAPAAVTNAPALTTGNVFPVTAGVIAAPFVVTNDYLYQPGPQTEVGAGGKALYTFAVTNAGTYVIQAVVSAPAEESNSFYLNIDAPPEDPAMIWDIPVTTGFEARVVSWRGDGSDQDDQFVPKKFQLTPGTHKLFLYGREPDVKLKTLAIMPETGK